MDPDEIYGDIDVPDEQNMEPKKETQKEILDK